MILCECERVGVCAARVEASIDITGESANRGALFGPTETLEPLVIEVRQRWRNMHQLGKAVGTDAGRGARDFPCFGGEPCARRFVGNHGVEIERFGGGQQSKHGASR